MNNRINNLFLKLIETKIVSLKNPVESLVLWKDLSERFSKAQNIKVIAQEITSIADYFMNLSKLDIAISYLNFSLDLFIKIDDLTNQGLCYNTLFICYASKGNDKLAIEVGFKALEIFDDSKNDINYFQAATNFNFFYFRKGKFKKAYSNQKVLVDRFENVIDGLDFYFGLLNLFFFELKINNFNIVRSKILTLLNHIKNETNIDKLSQDELRKYYQAVARGYDILIKHCKNNNMYEEAISYYPFHLEYYSKYITINAKNNLLLTKSEIVFTTYDDNLNKISCCENLNEDKNLVKINQQKEEIYHLKEQLVDSRRVKINFLHNLDHEIKTPLNTILGYTAISLENKIISEDIKDNLIIIKHSSEILLNTINRLLEVSSSQDSKLKIINHNFNIRESIEAIYKSYLPKIKSKNVKFNLDISHCPEGIISDKNQLTKIVEHLVDNAIKFTQEGSILLNVNYSLNKLYICVKDTGRGISKKDKERIFDDFEQVENNTTVKNDGIGVGLSLTSRIINTMNGTIVVDSEPGIGSNFIVTIPVKQTVRHREIKTNNSFKSMDILVVEDNKLNQKLLAKILKNLNMNVSIADNGQIALELLEKSKFDLIFMDIQMPVMDGYQAVRAIKSNPIFADIPVIAQTALTTSTDRIFCLNAGFDDYIKKPIEINILKEKLSLFCKNKAYLAQ